MSEPEPQKPPPASDKKKVDPGWNDPPMLNYNASNPPPKSRITNKRVPFPMSGAAATNTSAPDVNVCNTPPSIVPQSPPKN